MTAIPMHEPTKRKTKPQPPPAVAELPKPAKTKERIRMYGAADYGDYYFCAKSPLSENGEIYVYADDVRYLPTGGVLFVAQKDDGTGERVNLALAAGQWTAVFAAGFWDGHAIAVEHWKGEIVR